MINCEQPWGDEMIRLAEIKDAAQICSIYNYYVEKTIITFEEQTVSPEEMGRRIRDITGIFPWLVNVEGEVVRGYAYAGPWKTRTAYRKSVESTIYLHKDALGKGLGTGLYSELLHLLRSQDYHAVVGVIALPNAASIALHEKLGFLKSAHFKEIGYKFGKWIDVGCWQALL
jgi:L-amino acid N-acyltransferase YncA